MRNAVCGSFKAKKINYGMHSEKDVDITERHTSPERSLARIFILSFPFAYQSDFVLGGDSTPVVLAPLPARSVFPQARRYP